MRSIDNAKWKNVEYINVNEAVNQIVYFGHQEMFKNILIVLI